MRIATFNINNVNKRLTNLLAWLAETNPDLAQRLTNAGVSRAMRGEEGASDHAPTWIELEPLA